MKKSILTILLVLAVVSSLFLPANAASAPVNNQSAKKHIAEDFGAISVKDHINIGGNQRNLYETFDNPNVSLNNFKATLSDYLNTLQQNYGLADLNSQNYEDYVNAANNYMQSLGNNVTDSMWNNYNALQSFVDIFENNEENSEIYDIVNKYNTAGNSQDRNSDLNNLNNRLPLFDAKMSTNSTITANVKIKPMTTSSSFNISAGRAYAITYATSYNGNYKTFNEDCTDFASQILLNGGVSQINTGDVTTGWWYQRTILPIRNLDTNSNTWSLAKFFANYEGKYHADTSFALFSAEVKSGDFIGLDYTDDGDVDHVGFVTDTGSWNGSYWDFKVAQHSNNYWDWVSSSTNGWETNDNGINTFYILRRN